MPYVLGITGNIACGKTSVGRMVLELGGERYIDADALVHRLYEPGQPIALRVGELFGNAVLTVDGGVDRKALGSIVFHDPAALQRLESIVHPAVHEAVRAELAMVSPEGIVVLDAVKLLEGGSAKFCQKKWLIVCPVEQQLRRLIQRNGLSLEEAQARLQTQPDPTVQRNLVDEVIDNGGTLESTQQQVAAAFGRFRTQLALQ